MNAAEAAWALREYALSFPGAHEDFPWGDRVVKVDKKVFVFLGRAEGGDGSLGLSVKLPQSAMDVLEEPFAEPAGYGLGKAGWVSIHFATGSEPPLDRLEAWIDESYRAVAPKKRIKELDSRT